MADRIEREIEDIMRKLDGVAPDKTRKPGQWVGQPFSAAQDWLSRGLARISLRRIMMWSLFTVVVAFFMRGVPGASWIMIGALIVFVTAYMLSRGSSTGPATTKRWRGQPMDLSGQTVADRLKSRLKGRKRA